MRTRLLLSALAVGLAAAPAPASAATKPSCSVKGSKTVASNSAARVYTVTSRRDEYYDILFGCLRKDGRRVRLAEQYDDDLYVSRTFSKVRLNGRFVVWQYQATDVSCKADCPPGYQPTQSDVQVANLRTRRVRDYPGRANDALFVTRRGTPAWLEGDGDQVRVHAGLKVLDTGRIDSLTLRGYELGWANAGVVKSATLS